MENTIRSNILNNHKLRNNIILRNVDLAFNNIADSPEIINLERDLNDRLSEMYMSDGDPPGRGQPYNEITNYKIERQITLGHEFINLDIGNDGIEFPDFGVI